jgi:hypothetical protein
MLIIGARMIHTLSTYYWYSYIRDMFYHMHLLIIVKLFPYCIDDDQTIPLTNK